MNKHRGKISLVLLAAASVGLTACADDPLSLRKKRAPDEFTVVRQAPLTLPPNYNLRPPAPGSARPQDKATIAETRRLLFNRTAEVSGASSGEVALLREAGAAGADPDIRQVINRETSALEQKNASFIEGLLYNPEPGGGATVVDASGEADRLKKNRKEGKSATEGETPSIKPKRKALLEGLF